MPKRNIKNIGEKREKNIIPCGDPADNIRSILSIRLCTDFKTVFNALTLFLTPEILAACCIMKGEGASSSNLSSSEYIDKSQNSKGSN